MSDSKSEKFLSKRVNNVKKGLKNKRVLIYGTGNFFQKIYKDYNLSELNVIGVADKKYELNDSIKEDFGYKVVRISEIHKQKIDYILICLEKPSIVISELKTSFKKIKIISLNRNYLLLEVLNKIKSKFSGVKNRNNFVLIKQDGSRIYNPKIKNLTVNMWGKNSKIEIYEPFNIIEKCCISCGNNSTIRIHSFNKYKNAEILVGSNNIFEIGEYTTIERAKILLRCSKDTQIIIGKDCMLSYDILIRTTDAHSIYDVNTKILQNKPKNVIIGDHVWIGARSILLKGSKIPSNSIIGTFSLVNKEFTEENTVIAGNPAKVVKTNVNWDRRYPHNFN